MRAPRDKPRPPADSEDRSRNGPRALAALLREHPDALIYAQTAEGNVVEPPASLGIDGVSVLEAEGRNPMDLCVSEDRMAMVNAWMRVKREGVADAKGRIRSDPGQWLHVRMLDLRKRHGVILNVAWPTQEGPDEGEQDRAHEPVSQTPRFCTRKQDHEGNVFDCDEAYLQMFGYAREEVIGQPTFERVHPEDQARVIEGWISSVATARVQMFRVRMKRGEGSWLWVDTTLHNFLSDPDDPHVLAECIDVSAEMAAQEALQDREELLRNLIEEMPDGLLQLDRERNVVYHNLRLLEILDERLASAASGPGDVVEDPSLHDLDSLLAGLTSEARQSFEVVIDRALADGVRDDVELESRAEAGRARYLLVKVRPLRRDSGTVSGVIASVQDVTESIRARRELEQRATFDTLTGAHNRASIMTALREELERSPETGVVYLDLDHFKPINDTLGHAAGDEVLVEVAARLKRAMRTGDELGRLGGDEFVIVLRGVSSLQEAMSAAQRISDAIRGQVELDCGTIELCASVGVACVEDAAPTAEELVERADGAMYRSKEQRRGVPVLAV